MKRLAFLSLIFLSAFISKENTPKLSKPFEKNYVYLPSGKFEVFKDSTVVLQHFFISKTEVSNGEYRTFINYLKKINDYKRLKFCLVDSAKWKQIMPNNEPYVNYYHSHKAYDNYPVVNISYDAAIEYCKWLTDSLNKNNQSSFQFEATLPMRVEWVRATIKEKFGMPYAWGTPYLRYSGKKYAGSFMCNHRRFGGESITYNNESKKFEVASQEDFYSGIAPYLNNNADILAPVNSYWPSVNGAYNMNGNAAEMVLEKGIAVGGSWLSPGFDVRNESFVNYTDPSPTIGFRPIIRIIEKN